MNESLGFNLRVMLLTFCDDKFERTLGNHFGAEFWYSLNNAMDRHRIKVVGRYDFDNSNDALKRIYAMNLFPGAIEVIKKSWNNTGELPDESTEFLEGVHFELNGITPLDWVNFKLELPD